MKNTLRYSVLRYSPSKVAGEYINLGIIFVDETNKRHEFKYTHKLKRLKIFDDEVSIDTVKALLKGIQFDVNNSLLTDTQFDLDSYIKFYINNFNFDEPKTLQYEDWEAITERINKSYFRFDYDKSERPSKDDDLKLIEELIIHKTPTAKKNFSTVGNFNDKVTYDFVTDKYKIKMFDFDNKNLAMLINNAKTWAMNCMTDPENKSVIIYRYSGSDNQKSQDSFSTIKNIFAYTKTPFYSLEDGIQFIEKTH